MSTGRNATGQLDHAPVLVPPPLVFLGYLVGALVLQWARPFALPSLPTFRAVGIVLVVVGLALGFLGLSRLIRAHTSPNPHDPTTSLVTDGPYRFSRNPIYLGFLLSYLGFTALAGTFWGLILLPFLLWTVTHAVIHAEEQYLEGTFGEKYAAYVSRVRRWL